jgi:hypothetical protein
VKSRSWPTSKPCSTPSIYRKKIDYLRFFWFRDNDPNKKLVPHRAAVHIFGNRLSPAIAILGLRHTTAHPSAHAHPGAREFILNSFYVDDGLGAADTADQAINILKDARTILGRYNIRLHKIASSSETVLRTFPTSELAKDVDVIDLDRNPLHRSLGVSWDLKRDCLLIKFDLQEKPFTR